MKTKRTFFAVAVIFCIALAVTACKDEPETAQPEQPKAQSATISLFGGSHTATVQGTMTDSEWKGVAGNITSLVNEIYERTTDTGKNAYRGLFNRGVTFNVEKNPTDYINYKTTGDGKTIYINLSSINMSYMMNGLDSIFNNRSEQE